MTRRALILAAGALIVLAALVPTSSGAARARFDTQVFALIPTPGFPARAYVAPNHRPQVPESSRRRNATVRSNARSAASAT